MKNNKGNTEELVSYDFYVPTREEIQKITPRPKWPKKIHTFRIIGALALLVLATAIIIMVLPKGESRYAHGLYSGVEWRTVYSSVYAPYLLDTEKSNAISHGEMHLDQEEHTYKSYFVEDYDGYEGLKTSVTFKFENEKLYSVVVKIDSIDELKYTFADVYNQYQEKFNDLYGYISSVEANCETWETEKSYVKLVFDVVDGKEELKEIIFIDKVYVETESDTEINR